MIRKLLSPCCLLICCAAAHSQNRELLSAPRYHLRANDVLKVSYHLTPELDATVSVQPDGFVVLPQIGEVKLTGLDLQQATQAITDKAAQRLNHPELTVEITEFEKPHFFVGGRVGKPGEYTLNGPLTALQAIQIAEGFQESAKQTRVILIRPIGDGLGETHVLDLRRTAKQGKTTEFLIQDGDTLVVSESKLNVVTKYMRLVNPGVYVPVS